MLLQAGQSGNPNGRPRGSSSLAENRAMLPDNLSGDLLGSDTEIKVHQLGRSLLWKPSSSRRSPDCPLPLRPRRGFATLN
jgi:hypothetical protein